MIGRTVTEGKMTTLWSIASLNPALARQSRNIMFPQFHRASLHRSSRVTFSVDEVASIATMIKEPARPETASFSGWTAPTNAVLGRGVCVYTSGKAS